MKTFVVGCSLVSFMSISTVALAQECAHIQGQDWRANSEADVFLWQSGGGTISGYANPDYCAPGWSVEGTYSYSSGEFNLEFENPNGYGDSQYNCAPWVKFNEGDAIEYGCNEADFDLENPVSEIPSSMNKTCELPTGEVSYPIGTLIADPAILRMGVTYTGALGPWAGRRIQQWSGGNWGYDTCYFPGGPDPFMFLTHDGQIWQLDNPGPGQAYADNIGRPREEVDMIRMYNDFFPGHLPCGNGFDVDIDMHCGLSGYVEYINTVLIMEILNDTELRVTRGSSGAVTFDYPK